MIETYFSITWFPDTSLRIVAYLSTLRTTEPGSKEKSTNFYDNIFETDLGWERFVKISG